MHLELNQLVNVGRDPYTQYKHSDASKCSSAVDW